MYGRTVSVPVSQPSLRLRYTSAVQEAAAQKIFHWKDAATQRYSPKAGFSLLRAFLDRTALALKISSPEGWYKVPVSAVCENSDSSLTFTLKAKLTLLRSFLGVENHC